MELLREPYGKLSTGEKVEKIVLAGADIEIAVINYGCIITSIEVSDREKNLRDIVLGCKSIEQYEASNAYFGAVVGPIAGRTGNGSYSINDKLYQLDKNERGSTHLHGGSARLDKVIWDIESVISDENLFQVVFSCSCNNSDKGYPGNVTYKVKYSLNSKSEFMLEYFAQSDALTPVNMTNHTYFNLNGEDSGVDVLNHKITMDSDFYLPLKKNSIPTGEILSVEDTPFDFRNSPLLQKNISDSNVQLRQFDGFDHPFLLKKQKNDQPQVSVYNPITGIKLDVCTDQNTLVFYTCNGMTGTELGKKGTPYLKYYACCFETQGMPDALNNNHFPSILIDPEKNYSQKTTWKFSAE